jgi:GT2 family glycosyltransferase
MITVGIVYHRDAGPVPFESNESVNVVTHVNASMTGDTPWRGFGENHNALMESASESDWYVALNPDVAATRDDITRLVRFAERGGYTVAGPAIRTPWGMMDRPAHNFPTPGVWLRQALIGTRRAERHAQSRSWSAQSLGGTAWITGACMAITMKRPPIRFDERYFMYFEDVELCLREQRRGGTVGFCRDVVVDHRSGWSAGDPLRWRRGVEFARSALQFAGALDSSPALMRAAGLARFASRAALKGRTEPELVGARCVVRGFLNPDAPGLVELARTWPAGANGCE